MRLSVCSTEVALAIGAVTPRRPMTQASADLRGLGPVAGSDRLERVEDAESPRIEIGLDAAPARALGEIGFAPILAGQEPLRQAEIGDDPDLLAPAEIGEAGFEAGPVGEIVFRLQHFVARAAARLGRAKRGLEQRRGEVRGAAPADLAVLDQAMIGPESLVEGGRHVRPMREIEVDDVRLQAFQRGFDRFADVARRETLLALAHRRADLGDDDHAVSVVARFHPFADDRFGLAAFVARRPGGIGVGGVDGGQPGLGKTVEDGEGDGFIRGPAEDIAAQNQWGDR